MSEATGKRLNAVWKELNVGMQTLVDTLSKKGHKVDAKPTTKLTDEQYQILLNEFQADKKAKEAASSLSKDKPAKLKEITIESQKPKSVFKEDDDYEDVGMIIKSEQLSNKTAPKPIAKTTPVVEETKMVAPIIEPKVEEPIVVAPIEVVKQDPIAEAKTTPEPNLEVKQAEESQDEEDNKKQTDRHCLFQNDDFYQSIMNAVWFNKKIPTKR
jgi:translation initiation factor IF-2